MPDLETPTRPTAARPMPWVRVPGPKPLPVFGNLLGVDRSQLHLRLEAWRREYGDTFRVKFGPRDVLVIADAQTIATMLRDRPEGFQRTDRLTSIAGEMGFTGLFTANGADWRRQRPMMMSAFDPAHIRRFFPSMVTVAQRLSRRWHAAAAAGHEIDLKADLMRFTVDIAAGLAFGSDVNTLESGEDVIQRHLDQVFPALFQRIVSPIDWWRIVKRPADRRLERALAALQVAVQDFIAQARARIAANPTLREHPRNLIEAMVVARDRDGSGLSDTDVAGNVLTTLLAGEDTTAHTLAWMIELLWRHPAALAPARDEVRGVLGDARVPSTLEQAQALDWLEACAHETMRLKPVAPQLPLQAVHDTVLAGVEVPAGTIVIGLLRAAATDARVVERADVFDPARWIAGGDVHNASTKRVSMPFGAGPRMCPGRYLALLEMRMAMAVLLGGFDIEHVGAADGGPVREHLALTMSPLNLRMRLARRRP
jgi:cytochrome P450